MPRGRRPQHVCDSQTRQSNQFEKYAEKQQVVRIEKIQLIQRELQPVQPFIRRKQRQEDNHYGLRGSSGVRVPSTKNILPRQVPDLPQGALWLQQILIDKY